MIKRLMLLVLACLTLGLLAPTAGADAPGRAADKVTVVVKVKRCNGCQILPLSALSTDKPEWSGKRRTVKDGRVVLMVPRGRVAGLHLDVRDPDAASTNARTIAVARYAGKQPGDSVSSTAARKGKRGWHCWAGTDRDRVTLRLAVDRFPGIDVPTGDEGFYIRPYFTKTLRSVGPRRELFKGTFGAQDTAFCRL